MAVAWSSTKVGRDTTDVIVRDPVVLTATLPRFLLNGDHGTMSIDLDNVEGAPGDYAINVKTSGPVKVTGNPTTTAKLAAKQRTSSELALDAAGDERIKDAIDRLLARQGSNGSFGLWSAGGDDAWLDAYVTDFLTRAREKGFAVPDVLFKNALDRIRNSVVNANEPEKDGGRNLAYGLYVLARNGAAPLRDLRYLADTKLSNLSTPIATSQLAAALARGGDKGRAERVYAAALERLAPKPVLEVGRTA